MAERTLLGCESRIQRNHSSCPAQAAWKVRVGTRETDAQLACDRHLHMACRALYEAEAPRKPVLTVEALAKMRVP